MRLTIVQPSLHWENPAANRRLLAAMLQPLAGHTDLVLLPEMFTTGFSMNAATLAEPLDGPTRHWMQEQAHGLGAALAGSFICLDNGQFFNRLVFMRPDGQLEYYDKRHLFSLAHEHETFSPGQERQVFEWQGWRIWPLICYDLRFPVWSRQPPGAEPFDLLLYVANWPARRAHHWRSLLLARAIENQCFVAGSNIVGTDGNGLEYTGDSGIIDFSGQQICHISSRPGQYTAELSLADLKQYRQNLPFLNDADHFKLF
ncbi:MAG: amidohydrolase [Saprospiraceae bacterium]|nr:amidohydrolase [Saprospiraceae bacterium]